MITIGRRTMPSACASLISKRLLRKCSTAFHLAEPSALSCSPVKYKHQFQRDTRRSFSAWQKMTDVLFQRSNPILDAVQPISGSDEKKPTETLPDFGSIQMHHLEAAAKQAQADYDAALAELEQTISNWPTGIPEYSDVVPQLQRIETPFNSVRRIFQLYWTVQQDPITQIACTKAFNTLNSRRQKSKIIQGALKSIEIAMKEAKNNNNSELSRQRLLAVQVLLGECTRKGMDLDIDQTASDNDNYNDNPNVLEGLGSEIKIYESKFASNEGDYTKQKGSWTTREKIEDIYYLLALKKQKAKLLGFDNYVDMVLASQFRMASSSNQIKQLYKEVTPKLLAIVSSPPTNSQNDQEIDLRSYLTLDGVLGGMFGLSRALFGLVIREEKDEEKVKGWHPELRLFHVYDGDNDEKYMGSFYLDPYRREIKSRRNLTGTVLEQSDTTPYPLVFLSCNMRPPVWDHMPTDVTFDDALALFHEFGHALHFVLARDQVGGALGAQKIPLDMEEVVPQFMEHWLYQDSVLQSLAHLSQSDGRIPAEIIEKLKQQRSERKAHEILHSIFMSELELDVFSSDSEESVVAIQRKVADAYMPHEPFPKSDISPLMDIMESNSSGKPVAHYRYLWSEVMSADLFDIFEQAGLANEAEVKRLGRLFRETVLDPGATLDTKESFRKLRGRDMAPDTLLKMYRF